MSEVYYRPSDHFSPQSPSYCSNFHGARKDSWHHCHECRNKSAKWQSSITYRYLRNHESRQILVASLNVVKGEDHLTADETKVIIKKFGQYFKDHYPQAGYQLVLEASPNGRPHWHGIFLGIKDHEIGQAWSKACKGYRQWSQVEEIKTSLIQAINYTFKTWGEKGMGVRYCYPNKGSNR